MNKEQLKQKYFAVVNNLGITPKEAVVVSGGVCVLLGLKKETDDLDLNIPKELFETLAKENFHIRKYDDVNVLEHSVGVDLHFDLTPLGVICIEGIYCRSPYLVLEYKKKLNREKDQKDIKALEEFFAKYPGIFKIPANGSVLVIKTPDSDFEGDELNSMLVEHPKEGYNRPPLLALLNYGKKEDSRLSREERVQLAQKIYGLYSIGLAMSESERIDEDCCMDNCKVPFLRSQLKQAEIEWLEKCKNANPEVYEKLLRE